MSLVSHLVNICYNKSIPGAVVRGSLFLMNFKYQGRTKRISPVILGEAWTRLGLERSSLLSQTPTFIKTSLSPPHKILSLGIGRLNKHLMENRKDLKLLLNRTPRVIGVEK